MTIAISFRAATTTPSSVAAASSYIGCNYQYCDIIQSCVYGHIIICCNIIGSDYCNIIQSCDYGDIIIHCDCCDIIVICCDITYALQLPVLR